MKLRQVAAADLETIVRQRTAMFRDMGYHDEAQLDAAARAARDYYAHAIPSGGYHGWVVEEDGKAVAGGGVLISDWPGHPLDPQPRRAMILNVYTEPEYRRRGYARQLVTAMLDWCREQGFGAVTLRASREARELYEELGFAPTHEMRLELKR
jgi:GNAT superfamily N-acetyltransferase